MTDFLQMQLGGPVKSLPTDVAAEQPLPETGFVDNFSATQREMVIAGNVGSASRNLRDAYDPLVQALEDAGETLGEDVAYNGAKVRRRFLNPESLTEQGGGWAYGLTMPSKSAMRRDIFERIRARRLTDKDFLPGVPDTPEAFEEAARARTAAELQRIRGVQSGATGWGTVGGFAGGMVGSFEDPVNVATLPIGGASKTFVGGLARAAAENMLVEAVSQPFIVQNYAALGEDQTFGDSVRQVLFAGAAGGAFHGVIAGAVPAVRSAGKGYDAAVAKVFEVMPEPIRKRWAGAAQVDDRLLADTIRATVPEADWTREQRDAVNVMERDADIADASPFERSPGGDEAHATGISTALQKLIDGVDRRPVAGRAGLMASSAPVAGGGGSASGGGAALGRDGLIRFVMHRLEGGDAVVRYNQADGGTTKYGIAAKFNPGVDVANLTEAQAFAIAKRDYWFPELDRAPPNAAAVAFDAGFISGPKVGKRILAASGGDAERALALYRAHLNNIADTVPGKAKYRKGWNNRVDRLARKLGVDGRGRAEPMPELAGLGEARAIGDAAADLAERDAIDGARQAAEASEADAVGRNGEEGRLFEPVPILKRSLFASDGDWIDAQMALGRSIDNPSVAQSAGNGREGASVGPPGRLDASSARDGGVSGDDLAQAEAGGAPVENYWVARSREIAADLRSEVDQLSVEQRRRRVGVSQGAEESDATFMARLKSVEDAAIQGLADRRLAEAASELLSVAELDAVTGAADRSNPLWSVARRNAEMRLAGKEPGDAWGLRDRATGELIGWAPDRKAIERAAAEAKGDGRATVELLSPGNVEIEMRDRMAQRSAGLDAANVRIDDPALERFAEPGGEGAKAQVESVEHDIRLDAANDDRAYRVTDDGPERTLLDILDDLDAEQSGVDALRACLV